MMNPNEYYVQRARHDDRRREAERLAQLREARGDTPPFYAPALAGIGRMLVEVGVTLQERYGARFRWLRGQSHGPRAVSR
jgi:hypothetical protein